MAATRLLGFSQTLCSFRRPSVHSVTGVRQPAGIDDAEVASRCAGCRGIIPSAPDMFLQCSSAGTVALRQAGSRIQAPVNGAIRSPFLTNAVQNYRFGGPASFDR